MKIAVFPGSFNPFHEGHSEVVEKALAIFDKVIIAQGVNPEKSFSDVKIPSIETYGRFGNKVQVAKFKGSLPDFVESQGAHAVIRGLRNAQDLEAETVQQYWFEDLGLKVPIFYVICGLDKRHISSSALRAVAKLSLES